MIDSGRNWMPFFLFGRSDTDVKEEHERYDVYVNGDFVGHKILIAQNDNISMVEEHLKENGFNQFESKVEGDHFNLTVKDPDLERDIKENLNLYLQIR
jgi:hypothetical protein